MPDIHSGYGFAIGNVAAFDMGDPSAVVSPGGVGFDINCGVRLIRTNLVRRPMLVLSAWLHYCPACIRTHAVALRLGKSRTQAKSKPYLWIRVILRPAGSKDTQCSVGKAAVFLSWGTAALLPHTMTNVPCNLVGDSHILPEQPVSVLQPGRPLSPAS